jgi:hypothetical protein
MAENRLSGFVAGRAGRLLTIVLLTTQLGGCAVDMVTEQRVLMAVFCTAAFDDGPLEVASFAVWLVLCLSWFAGLVALRVAPLRPLYWALVLPHPARLRRAGVAAAQPHPVLRRAVGPAGAERETVTAVRLEAG